MPFRWSFWRKADREHGLHLPIRIVSVPSLLVPRLKKGMVCATTSTKKKGDEENTFLPRAGPARIGSKPGREGEVDV